ncbi:hypothetical protein IV487_03070 [Enterococcus saccharolyticus]|uniref:hypothetical protein n=1 Tax=Enterococcus saccharolyticus TaxID=41997 RepID=UPI001E4FA178|nr:hypothetical protein [Enterococcus saccharolyticus]MCD5001448.1 hypothetical protein [Enterococcus saccharolyticus]
MKFKSMLGLFFVLTILYSPIVSADEKILQVPQDTEKIDSIKKTNFPTEKAQLPLDLHKNIIQGELISPTTVDELKFTETEASENFSLEENLEITPMVNNRYFWGDKTAYFKPEKMQATTDIDHVWNRYQKGSEDGLSDDYPILHEGYYPMQVNDYRGSEEPSDFDSLVNQGHVNDYLGGAYYGYHSYNAIMTGRSDTITALASSKVRVRIIDIAMDALVFDSGYNSEGQYEAPAAGGDISYFSTSKTTSFGTSKTVYHIKFETSALETKAYTIVLSPYEGQYPTDNSQIDNLDADYHYAFYSGQPLPGKLSMSNITAHSSTMVYDDNLRYQSSFESPINILTISAETPSSQRNLYALQNITVKEYVSSIGNLNIARVSYKFTWPDNNYFYTLEGQPDTFGYTFSSGVSPIGKWQFKYDGVWKDSTNISNYFSGMTHMTMEYLAPYGYIAKY